MERRLKLETTVTGTSWKPKTRRCIWRDVYRDGCWGQGVASSPVLFIFMCGSHLWVCEVDIWKPCLGPIDYEVWQLGGWEPALLAISENFCCCCFQLWCRGHLDSGTWVKAWQPVSFRLSQPSVFFGHACMCVCVCRPEDALTCRSSFTVHLFL